MEIKLKDKTAKRYFKLRKEGNDQESCTALTVYLLLKNTKLLQKKG